MVTTTHEIALLRLVAQRIAGPKFADAHQTVQWMTAMQAQDYRGAITSVALRTASGTREAVEAAMNAGEIVRSWPMRGTLHFLAACDLGWMLGLTTERLIAGAASRREALGLDFQIIEQARGLAIEALTGGRALHRDELLAIWERADLLGVKQRSYHLIWVLSQTGTLCFGPVVDGEQAIVLLDEWVPNPRRMQYRDEALGELARRYFLSHGPATAKDFARWTGLPAADVKAGLAVAAPCLEPIEAGKVKYFMDPQVPSLLDQYRADAGRVFLLPGFDEYMLGYQDRSAALPAEFAARIVPGGNGMFQATVVEAGQVVGTWKRTGRGPRQTVLATPFTAFSAGITDEFLSLYQALA